MRLDKVDKKELNRICESLAPRLCEHHLMMFLCPDESKRSEFICAYLKYYINKWSEHDVMFIDEDKTALITLANPRFFSRKFSGTGAKQLKKYKSSSLVFFHRGNLAYVVRLISPRTHGTRVMNIYADPYDTEAALKLVDEAIEHAKQNDYTLIYETFSRRLVKKMKEKGFYIAYQRQFASTNFIETAMILKD